MKRRIDAVDTALLAFGTVAALAAAVMTAMTPALAMGVPLIPFALFMIHRIGLAATMIVGALLAMTFSAFLGRYAPAAANLTAIGGLVLVGVGLVMLPRVRLPPMAWLASCTFLAVATVQALRSAYALPIYGFRSWIALVLAPLTAAAVAGTLRTGFLDDDRRRLARAWLVAALVIAVVANIAVGFRQALGGLTAAELMSARAADSTYRVGDFVRLMGTFSTNQDFGLFAACFIPAAVMLANGLEGRSRRWSLGLTLALLSVTFLSLTRTALISATIASIVGLLVWGKNDIPARVVRLTVSATAAVTAIYAMGSLIQSPRIAAAADRALTFLDLDDDGSFNLRRNLVLPRAYHAFQERLFAGYGAGSAGPVSQQFPDASPLGPVSTDNGYLMVGIQLGVFGLIAFVGMLVGVAWHLRKSESPLAHAGSAALGSLLLAMTLAQYWSLLSPIALASAVVGLGLASTSPPLDGMVAGDDRDSASRSHPGDSGTAGSPRRVVRPVG